MSTKTSDLSGPDSLRSAAENRTWPATARLVAFFFAILIGLDVALDAAIKRGILVLDVVDIQTPAALYTKLDYLRRFDGIKVVLLGDSVVYGRAMKEAGDQQWREHNLQTLLQNRLLEAGIKRPVLVMNLGLNGALPTDLERLAQLVVPLGVDKVVFDVTLRSFSRDFSAPDARESRPWLGAISLDGAGRFRLNQNSATFGERIESGLATFLINHWTLYRLRDFVQWRLFEGEPASAIRKLRAKLDEFFKGKAASSQSADDAVLASALLTLKAKNRHDSVDFSTSNPQRAAFDRTLKYLSSAKQSTVLFYATEDATQIREIVEPARYAHLLEELRSLIAASGGRSVTYVPPIEALRPENFVDYVHLNREGNAKLADALVVQVLSGLK